MNIILPLYYNIHMFFFYYTIAFIHFIETIEPSILYPNIIFMNIKDCIAFLFVFPIFISGLTTVIIFDLFTIPFYLFTKIW